MMLKILLFLKKRLGYSLYKKKYHQIYLEKIEKDLTNARMMLNYAIIRQRYELLAMYSNDKGTTTENRCNEEIIISLTTHGKRLQSVFLTIESLFQQTVKANKIVLYLSDKCSQNTIPNILKKQIERGLEIKFVPDIRSYTKLIYALKDFPNATIINVDDDFLYPIDHIEKLIKAHQEAPSKIICHQAKKMAFCKSENRFTEYDKWEVPRSESKLESPLLLQYGAFGCLYPPHSLHPNVFDKSTFLSLAPSADDIWFWSMALLQHTPIQLLERSFSECGTTGQPVNYDSALWRIEYGQDIALGNINVYGKQNDVQLDAICKHFNLYDFFQKYEDSGNV
ncbi:MAG: hypothetical protein IJ905_18225 [Fibrobacter sp.]|nr:hypothetical protein [Fibrobacter sp.]